MTKRKPKHYDPEKIVEAVKKLPFPLHDKKHGYYIYLEEKYRNRESRLDHIADYHHELKVRDIECIPEGIVKYHLYKKDPLYKDTFNYYINRKGQDKGLIKISVQIDSEDKTYAWIKTVYITYLIK